MDRANAAAAALAADLALSKAAAMQAVEGARVKAEDAARASAAAARSLEEKEALQVDLQASRLLLRL